MIKKLAVLLIGQYRSWPTVSKYILNFFKHRATSVDYFFVTWERDWVDQLVIKDDILDNFDQNTATIKIVPDIAEINSFYRAAYLAKQANLLKKQKELSENFIYDQVVETRHDIYLRKNNYPWNLCRDYEYNIGDISARDTAVKINPLVIPDLYIRTNSFTNDILSNRYIRSRLSSTRMTSTFNDQSNIKFLDSHHLLSDYLMENRLVQIWAEHYDYSFALNVRKDPGVDLDTVPLTELDKTIVLCNFV
jgi:hypothetical protein